MSLLSLKERQPPAIRTVDFTGGSARWLRMATYTVDTRARLFVVWGEEVEGRTKLLAQAFGLDGSTDGRVAVLLDRPWSLRALAVQPVAYTGLPEVQALFVSSAPAGRAIAVRLQGTKVDELTLDLPADSVEQWALGTGTWPPRVAASTATQVLAWFADGWRPLAERAEKPRLLRVQRAGADWAVWLDAALGVQFARWP